MKLRKVNTLIEEKSNNEIAFEEQEKFKKNREDVIKSRTPEKVEKTGDIENAIKNSKEILNTKVPAVKAKKNDFSILESLLKEGFDFDVKSRAFTVNVVDRTALKKLCECLQKINAKCSINRSVKEGYRYCVTIKETKTLKESKALKEAVSDEAYDIAEIMNSKFENVGKRIYTRDDFDEQLALAIKEYFDIDNVWEIADDDGIANINGKNVDLQEFENDVRGILNSYGWATIYEGDYEGGITNYEEFGEDSYANEIIKIIKNEPWFKERYPDVRDFVFELVNGYNVDDTMTLGEFKDLLNSDFAKEFLGESLKEASKSAYNVLDIIAWISDHKTLYADFCKEFVDYSYNEETGESKNIPDVEDILDWLADHEQAYEDFKTYFKDYKFDENESLKEAKGIEHNPEEEKKFVGLDECDKSVKEDICSECDKEPCVCGPATDKDAEEHDNQVEKELTGKGLDEDLKIISEIGDYKPWAGAVDFWNEIVDADKVEELEFALEDLYPDGMTMTELNDLLWFEEDFVREQIGLAKSEEDDFVEESFEEKRQRIKESFDK